MKVVYTSKKSEVINSVPLFSAGKEYQVIADYRNRRSLQVIPDNGFVVIDNLGHQNMLFPEHVKVVEDNIPCYTFEYKS